MLEPAVAGENIHHAVGRNADCRGSFGFDSFLGALLWFAAVCQAHAATPHCVLDDFFVGMGIL